MNRRVRVPKGGGGNEEERGFYRYLKPGALAQLRNSRISARTQRITDSKTQIALYRSVTLIPTSNTEPQMVTIDDLPWVSTRVFAPRCPQRKKLVAAKSMFALSSSSPSQVPPNLPDSVLDVLNSDAIVGH